MQKAEEFLLVFENYEKALAEEKKYDFSDMLLEVIIALKENKSLLLRLQEKSQYILIDEHQDTNASQNKLIELISGFYEIPNLFVVGDEKQAIYRFQGASLENFLYFKKLYPSAKLINLEKNYRSHQIILDAAGNLIGNNVSANILPKKSLISDSKSKGSKIELAELSDFNMEYEFVARSISDKISAGADPTEIAVLARRNMDLLPLAKSLTRLGIKFTTQSDQNILNDLDIQKLLLIFKSIEDPLNEISFIKALHMPFLEIDQFDVYKLIDYSKKSKSNFIRTVGNINKELIKSLELERADKIIEFYSKYKGWITLSGNIPFDDLFVKVVNESNFKEHFLKSDNPYLLLNKLTGLFDEIKLRLYKNPKFNLEDFINLLQTVERHKVSLRAKSEHNQIEGVRLLTVHKSKGLEFECVFIINCFDGRWGNSKKRGAKIKLPWQYLGIDVKTNFAFEEIEDERRLFYVALTRAKKEVILTYAKFSIDLKEQLPSQFLQEIEYKFIETINTKRFEKAFDRTSIFDEIKIGKLNPKNEKYLQNLFLEKGLSITSLENFLECPWKYFFRNLVVLPDVKNKYLIFGTAMHSALDYFIKSNKDKVLSEKSLINKFKENLEKEAISEKDFVELIEKGERALKLLFIKVIPNWPKEIQSEMNIRGVKLTENVVLNGRLDMIETLAKNGEVRVHDFKTGKVKSRSQIDGSREDSKYNYKRQLVFYKILLDKYKEGLLKMREGVIDFIEPDDKDKFSSERFEISQTDVKDLEQVIKSVSNQIMNLSFWESRCVDQDCQYCALKKVVF